MEKSMADSGSIVPGLSNKYNSQATIEKIMNKKREKVDKMNDEKKKIDETRQSMGEVGQKVLSLDKIAKRLYGTGSSFENKIKAYYKPFAIFTTSSYDFLVQ